MFTRLDNMRQEKRTRIPRLNIGMWAVVLLTLLLPVYSHAEQTAAQFVNSCSAKIKQAGGISAVFSMEADGQAINGTMKSSGSKFVLDTPTVATWYNGKDMWTYNSRSGETTLLTPTPAELSEANPLLLITSKLGAFTASYAKTHPAGMKIVVLVPKTKGTGMKSVHVTVNPKTMLPVKLIAVPTSGRKITISLSSVKTGQKHADAVFNYPKAKYPKVKIVDLR